MDLNSPTYEKVKKKYLRFLKTQEILSEPFRNKIGQLNKFYIPICTMIYKTYSHNPIKISFRQIVLSFFYCFICHAIDLIISSKKSILFLFFDMSLESI